MHMSKPRLIRDILVDGYDNAVFSAHPKTMRFWLYKNYRALSDEGYSVLSYGSGTGMPCLVAIDVYLRVLCPN